MIAAKLKTILAPIVGNAFYANTFPETGKQPLPSPAIRCVVVDSIPPTTLCSSVPDESTDAVRVQLDVIHRDYSAMLALRSAVLAALDADAGPVWSRNGFSESYDSETKFHRCMLDLTYLPSTAFAP